MKKIVVVGAGASGMMAAGQAALTGSRVILLEKKKQVGSKLLISGKGRCNLTNDSAIQPFLQHFNRDGRFLHQSFSKFFAPELQTFFTELGVPLITERGGRVFPRSGKASDVIAALSKWLTGNGVALRCQQEVSKLLIENGVIRGVRCNNELLFGDAVILATGGASYPATGSTGEGYQMAREAGHSLTPLRPALVPLRCSDPDIRLLSGLDLRNTGVRLFIDGKRKINDFGEVGFTRNAICGPVTLTHSLLAVDSLRAGKAVVISIDLKPALDEQKLDQRLQRELTTRHSEPLGSLLRALLPQQLVPFCLIKCDLDQHQPGGSISSKQRKRLRNWLKDFRLEICGHQPLKEAIITAGGVRVKEIDPNSMESKKVKGLYLTGELLDINGETGGYNLQAAFSTGWVAGRAASRG